ncbi:MAG: hypothetical protein GY750_11380 [Lentisphaerae bacterium]|nr:hypothetical protein [Lentisphaerota bacterium]MCP4102015.1 hypothetical protein [Lentisphaerota bacterium]
MDKRGLIQFIVFIVVFGIIGLVNLYKIVKKRPQVNKNSKPMDGLLERLKREITSQSQHTGDSLSNQAPFQETSDIDDIKIYDEYGRLMTFDEPKPESVPAKPAAPVHKPPLIKDETVEYKTAFQSKVRDLPAAQVDKTNERADHFGSFIREHGKNAMVLHEILGKPVALRD